MGRPPPITAAPASRLLPVTAAPAASPDPSLLVGALVADLVRLTAGVGDAGLRAEVAELRAQLAELRAELRAPRSSVRAVDPQPELYSRKDAARLLRCSVSTIERAIARKRLEAQRVEGRVLISRTAIDEFLARGQQT